MVDIRPFHALRPNPSGKAADISKFICPPYDVISPSERESLVALSSTNVVQLELPQGEGDAKYLSALELLETWLASGVLQRDRVPSYYLLETTYRIKDAFAPKKELKRYGVLTALKLQTPGKGTIHPHERTLPKAKEDRLKLISAVKTNISPIFGLFFDTKKEWMKWVSKLTKAKPIATGREHAHLKHRLWKVDDPKDVQALTKMLKPKHLYIADGHHRYEVSWAYKEKTLADNPRAPRDRAWSNVMAYVCPMEEPGLLMLPTHRLVKSGLKVADWKAHLERVFTIDRVEDSAALIKELSKPRGSKRMIGWMHLSASFLLTLKPTVPLNRVLAQRPQALRNLDVILLHDLALSEAQGEGPSSSAPFAKEVEYTRDIALMEQRLGDDPSTVGFLLSSAGVASLAEVAQAGEVMPPKTTYFYPKVPTGFTLMSVSGDL